MAKKSAHGEDLGPPVAGNGLLGRRAFLEGGAALGALAAGMHSGSAEAESIGA